VSKNIKTVPTQDFEDVVATVAKYVEGLRVGKIASLSQAFHKDAVMYGLTNGEVLGGSIKNLYNFVEKNVTAPDIKTRVDVLAITPTTAVVRVDMENDAIGADYTDFHTLIKFDDTWQIIAKVYHMYEKT
jgi:Putative lumazine-binding